MTGGPPSLSQQPHTLDGPGRWASWPGSSLARPSQLSGDPEPFPGAPHVLSRDKAGLSSHPCQRPWQVLLLQTELRREADDMRAGAEKGPRDHTLSRLHQEVDRALRQNQPGSTRPTLGSGPGPGAGGVQVGVGASASVSCACAWTHICTRPDGKGGLDHSHTEQVRRLSPRQQRGPPGRHLRSQGSMGPVGVGGPSGGREPVHGPEREECGKHGARQACRQVQALLPCVWEYLPFHHGTDPLSPDKELARGGGGKNQPAMPRGPPLQPSGN